MWIVWVGGNTRYLNMTSNVKGRDKKKKSRNLEDIEEARNKNVLFEKIWLISSHPIDKSKMLLKGKI